MYKGKTISVIIPCYNEEKGIVGTLRKIPDFVDEILVVDNNSTDKTSLVAKKAGARVILETRKGYGYALRTGIESSKSDIVCTADGDATYPVEDLKEVLEYMLSEKLDFISCARFPLANPMSMGLTNIIGTKVLNFFGHELFNFYFNDILTGMWVFKKKAYAKLELVSYDWNLSEEIKIEAAAKVAFGEYHINHHIRLGDSKLMKWHVGLENLIFLFWKKIYINKPLPRKLKFT